jgi:hypothetical protein
MVLEPRGGFAGAQPESRVGVKPAPITSGTPFKKSRLEMLRGFLFVIEGKLDFDFLVSGHAS